MRRTPFALLLLLLALGPVGAARAEPGPSLEEVLSSYLAARDAGTRRARLATLRALGPAVGEVAGLVEDAWRWRADLPTGGATTWERETPDGVVHTVYVYVPTAYDATRSWPTLVYLHGDVTRTEDGGGEEGVALLAEAAEADGFLLLCPSTQDGAHWWTPNGRDLIHGALRDLRTRYRVDADRVAAVGRSDGASACFHLLAHAPDAFCCFVAFVGNPLVTESYGGPTWPTNLAARPVYAVNGGRDRLYPARRIEPLVAALREAGCRITWVEGPEAGHDLSFLERRWPEVLAFWRANPREAAPASVVWTTSNPRGARRAWVEILRLAPATASGDEADPPDRDDLPRVAPQPRLGLRFDVAYEGPGLLVEEVEDGTPAEEAGFAAGDVVVGVDGEPLPDHDALDALRSRLGARAERAVAIRVRRGQVDLVLRAEPRCLQDGTPPTPAERGYGAKPATVTAIVEPGNRIEVVTDGVGAVHLHLLPALLDLERELIVVLDGRKVFHGPVPLDLDHLLAEAWRNGPGAPVVVGCLELEVAPPAGPRLGSSARIRTRSARR